MRGGWAVLGLGLMACGGGERVDHMVVVDEIRATTTPTAAVDAETAPKPVDPDLRGTFKLTYYYVAVEGDVDRRRPVARRGSRRHDRGRATKPASSDDGAAAAAAPLIASPSPAPDGAAPAPPATESGEPGEPGESGEPREAAAAAAPDGTTGDTPVMAAVAPQGVTLYHRKNCTKVAEVSRAFAGQVELQGTGRLQDGRTINVSGPCRCPTSPCYAVIKSASWGIGVAKKPLSPFRTVAVDPRVVRIGSLLYIAELDGLTMPGRSPWGGFVHDGCVVAGDRGGSVDGKHLDFFVGKEAWYNGVQGRYRLKKVTVYDGAKRCQRKGGRVTRATAAFGNAM